VRKTRRRDEKKQRMMNGRKEGRDGRRMEVRRKQLFH